MGRVLVTGLDGFTGGHLRDELSAHGWEVHDLNFRSPDRAGRSARVDLANPADLHQRLAQVQPDAVVHLAAIAFVGHLEANEFYRVNLIGTRNLLEAIAAVAPGVRCVLLASSANVYGNATSGTIDERSPTAPANDYAVSKLAMEAMARLWAPKLPVVIARPFNYTGRGQSKNFLVPKIVDHFRRRAALIELGNLDVYRDFSDVRAVVQAYRRLLEVSPRDQVVNICSGRATSLREIINLVGQLTGHSLDVRVNSALVRSNEIKTLIGSPSKLQSLIGPWEVPPLKQTLQWMLEG